MIIIPQFNFKSASATRVYGSVVGRLGQNRVLGFSSYIDPTNFKRIPHPQPKSFNIYKLLEFIYLINVHII